MKLFDRIRKMIQREVEIAACAEATEQRVAALVAGGMTESKAWQRVEKEIRALSVEPTPKPRAPRAKRKRADNESNS